MSAINGKSFVPNHTIGENYFSDQASLIFTHQRFRDFSAFIEKAFDRDLGGLGTASISAAIVSVAFVEGTNEFDAARRRRTFNFDQVLHLQSPLLTFVGAAKLAQVVD